MTSTSRTWRHQHQKAIDKFLYEGERGKSESFTAYIASKQLARQEMESQLGEVISDRLCGRILLKQAGLTSFKGRC